MSQVFDAEHDLLPGTFKTVEYMEIMGDECEYVLAIVSNEFFANPEMKFFADYTQSLSISSRQRKLVMVAQKDYTQPLKTPLTLSFLKVLQFDRSRKEMLENCFLSRLLKSLLPSR